ncbi:hypothetical protein BCR43DRAFT_158022 [Syncephalastrum racemosum]|uniref:Uncharacterized protein n=1 Tax=Syncephalastrum racemosum TaxID=13706 RepID=A0A1X2HNJ4_SYNRA|nr:hypothetical protein BCR43DRAFT_158022 [Syncephalastrum racemosum]
MSQSSTSTHPTRLPSSHSTTTTTTTPCSPPTPPPKDKPSSDPNPPLIQQNQRRRLPKFWRQRTAPQVLSPSLSESSSSSSSSPSQSPAPSPKIALPFRSWRSGSDRVRRRSSSTQLSTDSHPSSPTLSSTIPVAPPLPESPATTTATTNTTSITTATASTAPTASVTTATSFDPNCLPSLLQHLMVRHDTDQATVAEIGGWLVKDIDRRPHEAVVDALRYLICHSHLGLARMRQCLDHINDKQSWPSLVS